MNLSISFEGLREMLGDLRKHGIDPGAILVGPNEKRDLKQELMAHCVAWQPEAEDADHDVNVIGFIEGVPIVSHPDVTRGTCRIIPRKTALDRNHDVIAK